MAPQEDALNRIAAALEQLGGTRQRVSDWSAAPAYLWQAAGALPVSAIEAPPLGLLCGIERQKEAVRANVMRLAHGHAAHDMLLWGARGTGKSALVRAAVVEAQRELGTAAIALVQLAGNALEALPQLFGELAVVPRNFLLFLDDLGFAEGDPDGSRGLRSWLEGGVSARPGNVRLAVTANCRAIVPRHGAEQDDPLNPRDALDDQLALADRFGLALGFHAIDQATYLEIVAAYAAHHGLDHDQAEALAWARQRGARSGRTAWQFVTELAGRAGRRL